MSHLVDATRSENPFMRVTATSVDVERLFSWGRIILSHMRNSLDPQTFHAMLCLGEWLDAGVIRYEDLKGVIGGLPDVNEEVTFNVGWDNIALR